MSNYPFCERYGLCIESVIHVVRDCGFAQAVWKLVVKWIIWNIRNVGKFNFLRGKWGSFYLIVCWLLWKNRNDFIFNHASGNSYDFISSTVNQTESLNTKGLAKAWTTKSSLREWWQLPDNEWVKVNVDGLVSKVNSRTILGGAIRDLMGVSLPDLKW